MADIDGRDFFDQKDYSSRSSDSEYSSVYSKPIQATNGDRSSSSVPTFASALPESTAGGGISERTPSPVPKLVPQSESVSHPEQDSQPIDQSGGRYVYGNSPPQPHPSIHTPTNDNDRAREHGDQIPSKGKNKCIMVYCVILLSVLLGVSLLGVIVGEVGIVHWLPNENERDTISELADLMPNDTILLYQGNASSITVSEVLPVSQKSDVSLFVAECTDLIQHTRNQGLPDRPLNFTSNTPVYIPTNPLHYELGSTIMFTITTIKATKNSSLDFFIFDNATKATEYSHNPSAQTGSQAIKHWTINTKEGGNSTIITFIPSYGSYFIPVLSPVPNPILDIELSYMIKQVFYFHGDYTKYANCSLDVEPCFLHFSTGNESCVLAYIPPLSKKVTLQTKVAIGEEHANEDLLLLRGLIGGIVGALALVLTVVLMACILFMCIKNIPQQQGYTQLETITTAQ